MNDEFRMSDTESIPIIDLGPYLAGTAGAVDRAAEELHFALTQIGFYFIVKHGVPPEQSMQSTERPRVFTLCRCKRSWRSS